MKVHECVVDGFQVYIGKDAYSNDYLSLKFGKANDYWFHVRGSQGSHVVLQCHDEPMQPTKDTIKKVASLSAYYSKQRQGGKVPVAYTFCKHVSKAPKAAPGSVIIKKEKIVQVKPCAIEEICTSDFEGK